MKKQILALVMGTALLSGCSYLCEECQDGTCGTEPQKVVYTAAPTLFAFDSAKLNTADKDALDNAVKQIKAENPDRVLVKGYADTTGSAAYNQKLSEKRAAAVAGALQNFGVDAAKISSVGYGETQPIATNATKEGRAQNRRVDARFRR